MISGFNHYSLRVDTTTVVDKIELPEIPQFLKTVNKKPLILDFKSPIMNSVMILFNVGGYYGNVAVINNEIFRFSIFIENGKAYVENVRLN